MWDGSLRKNKKLKNQQNRTVWTFYNGKIFPSKYTLNEHKNG